MSARRAAGRPEPFALPFEVRDYECDLQGIVNNAVYQHYLEHTCHHFLKQRGLRFAELSNAGINLVVIRAELDYKSPLRSGDRFVVTLEMARRSAVTVEFVQEIYRVGGEGARKLVLSSKFVCAAMNRAGKPIKPDVLEKVSDTFPRLRSV